MFPRTLSAALIILGGIWIIQGAGLLRTGSFMDGRPVWAYLGAAMLIAGLAATWFGRRPPRR